MQRIEVNCVTGERTIIDLTPEEIAEIELNQPAPMVEAAPIDPVQKLKSFLASNPDVAELLNE